MGGTELMTVIKEGKTRANNKNTTKTGNKSKSKPKKYTKAELETMGNNQLAKLSLLGYLIEPINKWGYKVEDRKTGDISFLNIATCKYYANIVDLYGTKEFIVCAKRSKTGEIYQELYTKNSLREININSRYYEYTSLCDTPKFNYQNTCVVFAKHDKDSSRDMLINNKGEKILISELVAKRKNQDLANHGERGKAFNIMYSKKNEAYEMEEIVRGKNTYYAVYDNCNHIIVIVDKSFNIFETDVLRFELKKKQKSSSLSR